MFKDSEFKYVTHRIPIFSQTFEALHFKTNGNRTGN